MNVNALFLADTAELRDDRLEVSDGAWDRLTTQAWPAQHTFQVVAFLSPDESDVGKDLETSLRVIGPDGTPAGGVDATIVLAFWREQSPVIVPVTAQFEDPGTYTVGLLVGEAERSITFEVVGPDPSFHLPQTGQSLN